MYSMYKIYACTVHTHTVKYCYTYEQLSTHSTTQYTQYSIYSTVQYTAQHSTHSTVHSTTQYTQYSTQDNTVHTVQYTGQHSTHSTVHSTTRYTFSGLPTVHRTAQLFIHMHASILHASHLVFRVVIDNQFFYETIDSVQLQIWRQIGTCE